MFHKIAEMYSNLKLQETLQESLAIQNLKSSRYSLQPYPCQPSEINLPVNLQ